MNQTEIEQLKYAYKDAVDVQDACNLAAVINSWARHQYILRKETPSDDELRRHPVNVLFYSKVGSLLNVHHDDIVAFGKAHDAARARIEELGNMLELLAQ